MMPRPRRRIVTGGYYHVLNRGNGRSRIFDAAGDYRAFIDVLVEGLNRYDVELLCWCLMPNHWHLVLRPRADGQLQAFMRWITGTHVRRHHEFHDRATGHLYQGRYKSFAVADDSHFLTLCRYVEANPMRAKLVPRAEVWDWSSLRQRQDRLMTPPVTEWPVDRPSHWSQLVNRAMAPGEIKQVKESIAHDRPLGPDNWARKMITRLGLPEVVRPLGRPPRPIAELSARQRRRRRNQPS